MTVSTKLTSPEMKVETIRTGERAPHAQTRLTFSTRDAPSRRLAPILLR